MYVAQIALGANDLQTTKAILEAEAWPGPSLIIAYSTCIAHGIVTSAVLRDGPDKLRDIESELRTWLDEREYSSVSQLRGSASQAGVEDPGAFERAQYIRTLHSWSAPADLIPTA